MIANMTSIFINWNEVVESNHRQQYGFQIWKTRNCIVSYKMSPHAKYETFQMGKHNDIIVLWKSEMRDMNQRYIITEQPTPE